MGYALFTPPSGQSLPSILPNTDAIYGTPKFLTINIELCFDPSITSLLVYPSKTSDKTIPGGSGMEIDFDLSNIQVLRKSEPITLPNSHLYYRSKNPTYTNPQARGTVVREFTDLGTLTWLDDDIVNSAWAAFTMSSMRTLTGESTINGEWVFEFMYQLTNTNGKMSIDMRPKIRITCKSAMTFPKNKSYYITPPKTHFLITNRFVFM